MVGVGVRVGVGILFVGVGLGMTVPFVNALTSNQAIHDGLWVVLTRINRTLGTGVVYFTFNVCPHEVEQLSVRESICCPLVFFKITW